MTIDRDALANALDENGVELHAEEYGVGMFFSMTAEEIADAVIAHLSAIPVEGDRKGIARLTVQRGDLTQYPLAERVKNGWQNGVTFYPDETVTRVQELDVRPAAGSAGDDTEARLNLLLWRLTDGRMSGTGYDVDTMVREVEAAFERNTDPVEGEVEWEEPMMGTATRGQWGDH